MFRKVLIANRGEIAVRIARACRDLGISPIAIYSEADRGALHVRMADEAYLVGAPPSSESYLVFENILKAAQRCGADAIHPGYGFLSENPRFAEACAAAGIPMIGPSADSIRLMGNKTQARSALLQQGVPIVPGTDRALDSPQEAIVEARAIGYPVMLKAAAGGGGKGMRLVETESRMAASFEAAASEALRAFSDPALYLEKFVARPRHVEIQVLADRYGNSIYLGERECSIQRRHQKVLEESPSPALDDDLRRRMGKAALKVVRAANYENAGTVEFLLDEDKNFYFLEMNTRLQVEHPVTEMVTGLDLVREQFRIAAGERLTLRQRDVRLRGWALECRIYAEDPDNKFFPSPGVIQRLLEPQGPWVRVDSGVYEGWEVPFHYDPLIAKLITFGADRPQAIERMKRAIGEYHIDGIKTNLRFFDRILSDPEFEAGRLSTHFIEEFMQRASNSTDQPAEVPDAAVVAAALAYRDRSSTPPSIVRPLRNNRWKMNSRPVGGVSVKKWRASR
jgi:acetyl-CoA carboxylase, biotin carboxylase subunit